MAVVNGSRKVLELVDYDFIFIFQWNPAPNENIKGETHRLACWGGNSRGENVLVDKPIASPVARSSHCGKRNLPWFPAKRVREYTSGHPRSNEVRRNVIRLDDIVQIRVINEPPPRKLNVEFAAVSFGSNAIPGYEGQNSRWFEMSGVLYLEPICSIS